MSNHADLHLSIFSPGQVSPTSETRTEPTLLAPRGEGSSLPEGSNPAVLPVDLPVATPTPWRGDHTADWQVHPYLADCPACGRPCRVLHRRLRACVPCALAVLREEVAA